MAISNLLTYLRSRTQVDLDSLDAEYGRKNGPFADLTSNQWEAYEEISKPKHEGLVKDSINLAKKHSAQSTGVEIEELAIEVAMIKVSLLGAQYVTGNIHIMANPVYAKSASRIVKTGIRFHRLLDLIDPTFDHERLVMKVPATWEGLQGCRQLTGMGIKTLGTTLFTFTQAVLAGEVGCTSISPFVHSLKLFAEGATEDSDAIFDLVVKSQTFYRAHGFNTVVKACAVFNGTEALKLAGVAAFTLPPDTLQELLDSKTDEVPSSLFDKAQASVSSEHPSFLDDESKFRKSMMAEGQGAQKLDEAISIFCGYQAKAENLIQSFM